MTAEEIIKNWRNAEVFVIQWKEVYPCTIEEWRGGTSPGGHGIGVFDIKVRFKYFPHETLSCGPSELYLTKEEAEEALTKLLEYPSIKDCLEANIAVYKAYTYLDGYHNEKVQDIVQRLKDIEKEIKSFHRYGEEH